MSTFLQGDTMRLKLGGKDIFHEVEVSLDFSRDFKEVATKDTDGKVTTPGDYSFGLSVSAKASSDTTTENSNIMLAGYAVNGDKLKFELADSVSGHITYSGEAYIEGFTINANNEESVDMSYSLKGTGTLTIGATA